MSSDLKLFFQDLEWRRIIANYANLENFYQLKPDKRVIYLGIDTTAESLHIGHLFLLLQTIRFAKEGFTVLLVLGGATSKIGDPSDKLKERPQLAADKLSHYYQEIRNQLTQLVIRPPLAEMVKKVEFAPLEQFYADNPELLINIYKILRINKEESAEKKWIKYLNYIWPLHENKYRILNNEEWLGKLSLIDFNKIGQNISVNYLLSKGTIKQRIENPATGLSYLAFSYSLLQAYDFYYLYENENCCGQIGGSDQWGNLTTGLKLISSFYPDEEVSDQQKINKSFAFTFNLLTNKEGKKYSKSESGEKLLLNSEKGNFVDFFLNLSDEEAKIFIRQFTFLEESQIRELLLIPPRERVLQKILVEMIYWLNYGELSSLKEKIKTREKKTSFFTHRFLGWWKKDQRKQAEKETAETWEILSQQEAEIKEEMEILSQQEAEIKEEIWLLSKKYWEVDSENKKKEVKEELEKAERKLLEIKYNKDKIIGSMLMLLKLVD